MLAVINYVAGGRGADVTGKEKIQPKGAPTAPELLVADAEPLDAVRAELLMLLERIGAGPREGRGPVHPLPGRLSYREWGVATYKHTDHHLRQFGA